jgi:hypothetical protein
VYPLGAGKWTIGSSARCHIQLPAAESRPIHCLVALDAGAVTATRWAAGVLLNDREFAKQSLRQGDRLSIGAWELRWEADDFEKVVDLVDCGLSSQPATPVRPAAESAVTSATIETRLPESPASTGMSPRTPALRPAAKTVMVASRKTDPFHELLGPTSLAALPAVAPVAAPPHASLAFQDRLVLDLWAANFAARTRVKSLTTRAREARARACELAAAAAELESKIAASRSAADAHSNEQKSQIETLRAQLQRAIAERDGVAAELESLRSARPRTAPPDPRLQMLADACEVAEAESLRLREQLAESEQQIAALQTQIADVEVARGEVASGAADQKSQLDAIGEQLKQAISERDEVAAELETLRTARPRTAPPDPRLQTLADACAAAESESLRLREHLAASEQQIIELQSQIAEVEAGRPDADAQSAVSAKQQAQWEAERDAIEEDRRTVAEEVARLTDEVRASELHIERLEEQAAAAEAARAEIEQQLADQQRQQAQWLAECRTLQNNHADEVAEIAAERDALQRRLDEQAQASAPVETAWPLYVDRSAVDSPRDAAAEAPTSYANVWRGTPADAAVEGVAAEPAAFESAFAGEIEPTIADDAAELPPPSQTLTHSPPSPSPVEPAAPEQPFAPTSFIDKYRHLLEDDGSPEPSPRLSRPLLDDEYLSPSKFPDAPSSGRDDESDEALEAYMSNLMRRVRTPGAPASQAASTLDLGMSRGDEYVGPTASQELEQAESTAAAMPVELDANGMVRTVRKQPPAAANLSALRELANNSARMAIAQHRQRRHTESTVTKGLIFSVAAIAAAYLMLTAPGVESPWFWGGCVALVAAGGAAAQLITQFWSRFADVRLEKKSAPKSSVAVEIPAAVDAEPVA